jgi:hypothetical protein
LTGCQAEFPIFRADGGTPKRDERVEWWLPGERNPRDRLASPFYKLGVLPVNRLLILLTSIATLITAGCNDSVPSGEFVPISEIPPSAGESTAETQAIAVAPGNSGTPATSSATTSSATTVASATPTPDTTPDTAAGPPMVKSDQSGLSGPADRPTIENSASAQPRSIQLLIPNKRFRKERPSNALRVSYDDIDLLKVLNMEPVPADAVSHFPEWLKQLDGQTVRIRGYMYPTFEATGLTSFTLARDNGICCFVRQPKIYDIISISLAPGEVSDYIANRPFDVEGIFRIDPSGRPDGPVAPV